EHDDGDVQTHDVTNTHERRAEIGSRIEHRSTDGAGELEDAAPKMQAELTQFEASAKGAASKHVSDAGFALRRGTRLTGSRAYFAHLSRRDAFRKAQAAQDDQGPAQSEREQHAEQSSEASEQRRLEIIEIRPGPQQDQRRQREDRSSRNALTRRRCR